MFARALIVLLLVLNLGVAAWWLVRPEPASTPIEADPTVARLQLLSEAAPPQTAPATPARTPPPVPAVAVEASPAAAAADATPPALQCASFGPFATAAAAEAARARLQPQMARLALRTAASGPVAQWRVLVPPQASDAAAKAMAGRIAAAGFDDFLVLHEGSDAHAIALGLYGSEATARRRLRALEEAGFAARMEPVGAKGVEHWLDLAAPPGVDLAAARAQVAAPGQRPLDCDRLR